MFVVWMMISKRGRELKMAERCKVCGSYGINQHLHDRITGIDLDLCDVCYWKKRAIVVQCTECRFSRVCGKRLMCARNVTENGCGMFAALGFCGFGESK